LWINRRFVLPFGEREMLSDASEKTTSPTWSHMKLGVLLAFFLK
jgi:hypothetical protein